MNLYIVESDALGKRWVTQAKDTEDATGKVLAHDREWIAQLEAACPWDDLEVDLKISLVESGVTEL
jgi:hypothetical protein